MKHIMANRISEATHYVKFYGVKCYVILNSETLEFIGTNSITDFLLKLYATFIFRVNSFLAVVMSSLGINYRRGFMMKVLHKMEES